MKRIYFIHRFIKDLDSFIEYMHLNSKIDEELIWDDKEPEILFVSEWIYYQRTYFLQFKKLYSKAKIKILYAGEAIEPDMNLFDYAIGFSDKFSLGDRFIRLHSPLDMFNGFISTKINNIKTEEDAKLCLKNKRGFCNFLYSNPNAHPKRDELFYEISKYKRVDSLGRHLNNVDKLGTGYAGHSKECSNIKSLYKFSIASENAIFDGYTSEKVLTSLEAHSVPIYWGNNNIEEDVNPNAIINVNKFKTYQELCEYIKYVDTHDDVWLRMVMEPWFTEKQLINHVNRSRLYEEKIKWLLEGELTGKERLAQGTHIDLYRINFFNKVFPLQLNCYNWKQYLKKTINYIIRKCDNDKKR